MKEYIEREAVLKELDSLKADIKLAMLGVYKAVDVVPAADVAPVVHGEWIPIVNHFHGKPDGRYYCSVCHRVETIKGIYCRICGARMDGGNSNG